MSSLTAFSPLNAFLSCLIAQLQLSCHCQRHAVNGCAGLCHWCTSTRLYASICVTMKTGSTPTLKHGLDISVFCVWTTRLCWGKSLLKVPCAKPHQLKGFKRFDHLAKTSLFKISSVHTVKASLEFNRSTFIIEVCYLCVFTCLISKESWLEMSLILEANNKTWCKACVFYIGKIAVAIHHIFHLKALR